jgi:hypothetical protein
VVIERFEDAEEDPDVLFVGGECEAHIGSAGRFCGNPPFLLIAGRVRAGVQCLHRFPAARGGWTAARLSCCQCTLGCSQSAEPIWR